uniref:Uncharacterized protein n=1 Tax=Hordeum vulgare subsp. vulgare TaxID=112509 RepID=A0A8I6YUX3_HORVV
MSFRKCLSGSEKRKIKKQRDELIESEKGSIDNFFRTGSSSRNSLQLAIVTIEEQQTKNLYEDYVTNKDEINLSEHENLVDSTNLEIPSVGEQQPFTADILDP